MVVVSVPSFGDSFFICGNGKCSLTCDGFRPLIRGFFFYEHPEGILGKECPVVSVPSFGDSFFILNLPKINKEDVGGVSVPSFGDSFFMIKVPYQGGMKLLFPSPHSGILFL